MLYARSRAESDRFAFIMAELNRIESDYDPKTQSFYKPISLGDERDKISTDSRSFYVADALTLYDDVMTKLPISIKNRVKGGAKINCGFGANKLTVSVSTGDGPMLIFALICMFRPCVGVEEDIEEIFTKCYIAFRNNKHPMTVITNLRSSLLEATELHTEFKWSQSGARIVEELTHSDHNMCKALEDYAELNPPDSQVTAQLTNLFAAIERQCDKEIKYDDNKRTANGASVLD